MGPSQKASNMFTSCDKFCGVLLTLEDFLVSKQADGFWKRNFIFSDFPNSSEFVNPVF